LLFQESGIQSRFWGLHGQLQDDSSALTLKHESRRRTAMLKFGTAELPISLQPCGTSITTMSLRDPSIAPEARLEAWQLPAIESRDRLSPTRAFSCSDANDQGQTQSIERGLSFLLLE